MIGLLMQMMMQVVMIRRLSEFGTIAVHWVKETIVEAVQFGRLRLVIRGAKLVTMVIAGVER